MPDSDLTQSQQSAAELRTWLIATIVDYLEIPAEAIDPDVPIAEYGLDSFYAFALCGDIEERTGLAIEPVTVWDAGTISALAALVAGQAPRRPAPSN